MKSKKLIAAAMVAGMAVSGSVGAFAASNVETIKAQLNHGLGFVVNGKSYSPTDASGKKLDPITYNNTTYLPVRALGEALNTPVTYDAAGKKVVIGSTGGSTAPAPGDTQSGLTTVTYTASQKAAAKAAFAKFDGFETVYAPMRAVSGDTFRSVAAGADSVTYTFDKMKVSVSPRDEAYMYDGTTVTLSNGVKAKWIKPSETEMLTFAVGDRFVSIWSEKGSLTKAQIQSAAVYVEKASF
ncbi:stalk domain-containing protein [Saccharibacillus sp. CPCC 101409]|uniref:stalk domain-containing protein n=1 Tax=Saccharibacillus sp. CPCC 101409 TaxID=3058041 RepID=UPI0026734021|nr:stalk domain-containing protein [Saccharibacillus sp. CPCC 101409]MDO3410319.1 stalk domain-containing protein [Saccharibacillus sp. CPCC 101409]